MKTKPVLADHNTCIKCRTGKLIVYTDEMNKANGLLPERKCNNCGKEYPAYPFTYGLQGLHGKRPPEINLYLDSLVREMMPIQKDQTVKAICAVLGVNDKLIYGFYTAARKEMGISGVGGSRARTSHQSWEACKPQDFPVSEPSNVPVSTPRPSLPAPEPSILTWTKTETIVQPWKIDQMNGIMPEFEEEIVVEWTGKIVSREVREKK